jgi:hypothetical protein
MLELHQTLQILWATAIMRSYSNNEPPITAMVNSSKWMAKCFKRMKYYSMNEKLSN